MNYEKSDWFKGFIFAEKMHQQGWFVEGLDYKTLHSFYCSSCA